MPNTMYSLNKKDVIRGLTIAVLVPVFAIIQESIVAGSLVFDWKAISIAAIGGLLAYLTKNFFTDGVVAAKNTLVDAHVAEIKKSEPDPEIAAEKIEMVKEEILKV